MATAQSDIDFDDLRTRVKASAKVAVAATTMAAGSYVRESMPGPGAGGYDTKDRGTGENDRWTPSDPGTPPGVRRGASGGGLISTINESKLSDYEWQLGTNSPYARIHEFGGTINHPGGTPYIITDKGAVFIKKETADRLRSEGRVVKVTKPHTINMPARPFFGATIDARQSDLVRIYREAFNKRFVKGI